MPGTFPPRSAGSSSVALEARTTGLAPLTALGHSVVSLILCGGVFYLLRADLLPLRGVEGLGLGDVKLAATGGIWLGWEIFPAVVTLAAIGAIVWVAVAAAHPARLAARAKEFPFGAFLAPAIWVCWLYARMAQA